ncbi:MAG: hypothetical protein HZC47_11360 [Methanobacterium sp.]|uniref:hypothetical protein n=1 Tax=Methanobacterium sp. TaxID=2164 RepID=UPI003D64A93C|nr:hypothetical protein [Methanobacterium sp.]
MKNSKINLIILIILAVAMYPFGNVIDDYYPAQGPTEITSLSLGDTVVSGTLVVDESKIRKVPLLYPPEYLLDYVNDMKFSDFIDALLTGTVKTPIGRITSNSISKNGTAQGFNGPGILAVTENKLTVSPPGIFVYGYKTPYTYGIKTNGGLEIKEGKKTIKTVPYDQINNDTVPHNYVTVTNIKKWFNNNGVGESIALDYGLAKFNDGRNFVAPSNIKTFFGEDVVNYMEEYASGLPVLVYMGSVTEKVIGSNGDSLGSFPQYNDAIREQNSREFVEAWNGTIIPPHTTSSGKETVGFGRSPDPHAPGGWASHGVCPAARAMRGAVSQAGFGLPTGLTWGEYAVMFGFNPATDVRVTNTKDYPVKIVMWTSGSGPGMSIHAKVIGYIPQ